MGTGLRIYRFVRRLILKMRGKVTVKAYRSFNCDVGSILKKTVTELARGYLWAF
jgi:hypothetical protein